MNSCSFAQIGDPHLTSLDDVNWRDLCSKRILGYLSWTRRRRHLHRGEMLSALQRDLQKTRPDSLLVAGDLTQIALPGEYRQALGWLEQLGEPSRVLVIPGNHDAYVQNSWAQGLGQWSHYISGDSSTPDEPFPSLRVRNGIALIGLSSAVPTAPFMATGRLGRAQLQSLSSVLERTAAQGLFRVVLIHHPPIPGSEKWRKRLVDAEAFCAVIEHHGAELICHGHSHRWQHGSLPANGSAVNVIGSPSASSASRNPRFTGAYALYRVTDDGNQWQLDLERRRYDHACESYITDSSEVFKIARPARTELDP